MPFNLTTDTLPGTATWSASAFNSSYAGGGTIGAAATDVVIAAGAFWPSTADGGLVILSIIGVPDASAISFASSWDGSGNLTITANAAATADVSIAVAVLA